MGHVKVRVKALSRKEEVYVDVICEADSEGPLSSLVQS